MRNKKRSISTYKERGEWVGREDFDIGTKYRECPDYSVTKGKTMKEIFRDFLFKERHSSGFLVLLILLSMATVNYYIYTRVQNLVCFEKHKLTEIEKQQKTKSLLRGPYHDV